MTTDSFPLPSGGANAPAGPPSALATAVAGQRAGADRAVLPVRAAQAQPSGAPPFVAADCTAVLLAGAFLDEPHRDAALLMQLTVLTVVLNLQAGLHRTRVLPSVLDELPSLAARVAVVWCAAAALAPGGLGAGPLPLLLCGAFAVHLGVVVVLRGVIHGHRRRAARARPRSALVVGTSAGAQRLCGLLAQHPEYGMRPVGVVTPRQALPQQADETPALPVLTSSEDTVRAVIQNSVRDVLFTPQEAAGDHGDLIALLHRYGCTVWLLGARHPERRTSAGMSRHLWGHAYQRLEPPAGERGIPAAKRALDVVVAGLMLLGALPLLAACALAVRVSDGPGVLFRQERVGMHGRLFVLLKFRTLRPADDREAATTWSVAHDHRVGPVGRFLRRTSLDELPQLWNVLRGDMSLVGPRPERPFFVAQFSRTHPGYAARHRMVVGLTGLAQVHGLRGDTSIEDRARFDNHYIDQWSWWQDVCILVRTAVSLIRPAGS
ncbi:exopolysaccharide biosynthesis polyprenyl glycosylphosphotransferase [Streptomyces sp. NPDC060194]|uniref:exopolysaccharide biosynthesis polyprenyl glycosylphosphotransferase n=1 Tax=Streptomyces sp. NPDC060194 TaxID=3347069 RepID=UPI00365B3FCE